MTERKGEAEAERGTPATGTGERAEGDPADEEARVAHDLRLAARLRELSDELRAANQHDAAEWMASAATSLERLIRAPEEDC